MTSDEKDQAVQAITGFIEAAKPNGTPLSESHKAMLQASIRSDLEVNGWTLQQCLDSDSSPGDELMNNFPETANTMFFIYLKGQMS